MLVNIGAVLDYSRVCNTATAALVAAPVAASEAALAEQLAGHVIESCLSLWRSVLCSSARSDVVFALAPVQAPGPHGSYCIVRSSRHDDQGKVSSWRGKVRSRSSHGEERSVHCKVRSRSRLSRCSHGLSERGTN